MPSAVLSVKICLFSDRQIRHSSSLNIMCGMLPNNSSCASCGDGWWQLSTRLDGSCSGIASALPEKCNPSINESHPWADNMSPLGAGLHEWQHAGRRPTQYLHGCGLPDLVQCGSKSIAQKAYRTFMLFFNGCRLNTYPFICRSLKILERLRYNHRILSIQPT